MRDHDAARFGGLGVSWAVAHVKGPIADPLTGRVFDTLADVDAVMIGLDGTADKSRLGANTDRRDIHRGLELTNRSRSKRR